jgi:general secretion pathway protein G
MRRRAFTLVELLIVIIIIAVLAAVVVPKFASSTLRAREASLKQTLKDVRVAIDRFRANTTLFPASLNDLTVETPPANGVTAAGLTVPLNARYEGPYMEKILNDPISGSPLTYQTTAPGVGKVTSSASGTASDGTLYSAW